ncbi:MAG: sulfatase-like hydrolase/transferase [Phycisphaerales bacterium]|nr:MAG: sulfatase-like hydrolase/transferase [Phycisphaerales bacterium]
MPAAEPRQGDNAPAQRPPNIVFILSDDQAPGTLGVDGNPRIKTPRLDQLAREGVFFSRAYVPIPLCAPSRAAILTGLYPHQNGVTDNTGQIREGTATFSELFKRHGYHCGLIGKWHLDDAHKPQHGFEDAWITLWDLRGGYINPSLWIDGREVACNGHLTSILTDYAIRFVEDHAGQPFLLWLNYKAPHKPCQVPPGYRGLYRPRDMPLPESIADDLSTKPAVQRSGLQHKDYKALTEKELQKQLAPYYALISFLDFNVGRLVDRIKELNLERRTLIIYMSDNGQVHGEHQMVRKAPAFYEELVRSPLIMHWPGHIKAGTRIDALVSSLDLFPTMAAAANVSVSAELAGASLWPLIDGQVSQLHDSLFFEFHGSFLTGEEIPVRGLVTARHKYVRYLQDGEELYDLREDPHEMKNLIGEATHADVAGDLRRKLTAQYPAQGDAN